MNVNYEYVEHTMIQWNANLMSMSWNFIKEFYVLADNMKRVTCWSWCTSGSMLLVPHILLSRYNPSLQSCCNNASYFYTCHTIEQSFFIYNYVLQHSSYKDISSQMARLWPGVLNLMPIFDAHVLLTRRCLEMVLLRNVWHTSIVSN